MYFANTLEQGDDGEFIRRKKGMIIMWIYKIHLQNFRKKCFKYTIKLKAMQGIMMKMVT